jgi:hypothetical protein
MPRGMTARPCSRVSRLRHAMAEVVLPLASQLSFGRWWGKTGTQLQKNDHDGGFESGPARTADGAREQRETNYG